MSPQQKLETLIAKLEELQRAHQNTSIEIVRLRTEVNLLKKEMGLSAGSSIDSKKSPIDEVPVQKKYSGEIPEIKIDFEKKPKQATPPPLPSSRRQSIDSNTAETKKAFDTEAFIGGNLINKIGILILIIGLGLFVKYAIDNGYFPPIMRLSLSFLAGLTLVGIGYRLKPKYKTYSAVLFSGGMVVLYFSAYSGHAYYDPILIPRATAFILMVVFTVVTVLAAMIYNLQIIALLGLVGAYTVPLLLSDDSGNYKLFLSYIAIINTGVLLVAIRKNWRLTLYLAFTLTWLILSYWILTNEYIVESETGIAWLFNVIFFLTFYIALIAHNLLKDKQITFDNIVLITINAFIFYCIGLVLFENSGLDHYQGLFTLCNGVLHLGVAFGLFKKLGDKQLFYAVSGLFWVFLTAAIGIQFGAEVSAILWLGEAALLFGLSRRFKIQHYEIIALFVFFIGIAVLFQTWSIAYYNSPVHHTLLINKYFLVSVLSLLMTGAMVWIHNTWEEKEGIAPVFSRIISGAFIGILYFSLFNEIFHQFDQVFINSEIESTKNWDILNFRTIWLINYSFLFAMGLMLFNRFYFKGQIFGGFVGMVTAFVILSFLTGGIFSLNDLRTSYLNPDLNPLFETTTYWIWIRYISYLFLAAALYGLYKLLNTFESIKDLKTYFQLGVYLIILVVLSTELTTFMTMAVGVDTRSLTHKVGFSILWAMYSLLMIIVGFRKRSKLLRIAGIILFAFTLVKVFFVDLIDISTESRILLFVAIGVLLLITSYFYQRYRDVLIGDDDERMSKE